MVLPLRPKASSFPSRAIGTAQQKITFADMRDMGMRGCSDCKCSHLISMSGDRWPNDMRLSDLEPRFICTACGKRGADVRSDFDWDKDGALRVGY
jgi:hypothetical protein